MQSLNLDCIDPRAWAFIALCKAQNITARLVGGCVRDIVQKACKQSHTHTSIQSPSKLQFQAAACVRTVMQDIDICVDCPPANIIKLCHTHHINCIPTGLAHGTVTVIFQGHPLEITSLRQDVATNGRHAKVAFTSCFEEDACRRDFTMNALYLDCDGTLFDYHDGIKDLASRHVRFIGCPADRIHEDYLRLYRYFRFCAILQFPTALDSLPPIHTLMNGLNKLSMERVRSEFFKIMMSPFPYHILRAMHAYGLLVHVIGVNTITESVDDNILINDLLTLRRLTLLERKTNSAPNRLRRLAVFSEFPSAIRYLSKKDQRYLQILRDNDITDIVIHHPQYYVDALLLATARAHARSICLPLTAVPLPPFPAIGADIGAVGFEGAQISTVMKALRYEWFQDNMTWSRAMTLEKIACKWQSKLARLYS